MGPFALEDLIGIGGIEGDPEEYEFSVFIFALLGPIKPTKCSVGAQRQAFGMTFSFRSLASL